jgi:hypothetical protein
MNRSYPFKERSKPRQSIDMKKSSFRLFLKALQIPSRCHEWDDFFDFSRMSIPKDNWTLTQRLCKNIFGLFLGNYLCVWALAIIITGICFSRKLFFALIVIMMTWILVSMMTIKIGSLHSEKTPKFKLPRDEKVCEWTIIAKIEFEYKYSYADITLSTGITFCCDSPCSSFYISSLVGHICGINLSNDVCHLSCITSTGCD